MSKLGYILYISMNKYKNSLIGLLRWAERYTKTDMVYVVRGGFWLGLGQFVSSFSTFLISLAFANLIVPETFGIYKFVLSVNSLLLISTLSGMDSAVTQSIARGFDGTLWQGIKSKIKFGFFGLVISLLISTYYFLNDNNTLGFAFLITSFFIPLTESFDMYNSLLWGKKLFNIQAKYNIINLIIITFGLAGTLYFSKNIYLILLAYFLTLSVPNFFFYRNVNKYYVENNQTNEDTIKYGKHLSLINVIGVIASHLDKILIFHYVGPISLAIYSLATAPNDQIKGLLKNLNSLAMPKLSEKNSTEVKINLWRKVGIISFVVGIIVIIYIILSPILFSILFPKYSNSVIYSQVLSISLIPVIISGFLSTILESQKATKELYRYGVITNIFSLVTMIPLVSYFGIWGAVISRLINRSFGFGMASILVKNLHDEKRG